MPYQLKNKEPNFVMYLNYSYPKIINEQAIIQEMSKNKQLHHKNIQRTSQDEREMPTSQY